MMELLNSNKERIQSNIFVKVLSVIRNLCFCVTIYCMTFFRDVQRCKYFYFIAFLRRALCFFSLYGDFMIVYCIVCLCNDSFKLVSFSSFLSHQTHKSAYTIITVIATLHAA